MAHHDLITAYLVRLRRELNDAHHTDDDIDEVTDHLLTTVERRVTSGTDLDVAQRTALEEFGHPRIVGQLLISAQYQGAIMPTTFTKRAGYLGMISLATAIAAIAFLKLTATAERIYEPALAESRAEIAYGLSMATVLLFAVFAWGIATRVGRGRRAKAGASILTLGAVIASVLWWAPIWTILLTVGMVILAIELLQTHEEFRFGSWMVIGGSAVMTAGIWWGVIYELANPTFPEHGLVGWVITAGLLVLATGMATLGRIMASEPVTAPTETAITA